MGISFGETKLAAFFGALKLAVAAICALHIADRLRCWTRGEANSEILEGGLILVVAISIASVGPASWSYSADLMREHTYQLLFAAPERITPIKSKAVFMIERLDLGR